MKLYRIKVKPKSSFATPPKGDTLLGQIAALLFLRGERLFSDYLNSPPKVVFSDLLPSGHLYRPHLPLAYFGEVDKKQLRKARWINQEHLQKGELDRCVSLKIHEQESIVRNTLHRLSGTTSGNTFAPYASSEQLYFHSLDLYALLEESCHKTILDTLKILGEEGFGKDVSIGRGRFEVGEIEDVSRLQSLQSPYALTLSPCIPKDVNIRQIWYEPFTRFGRFGYSQARGNFAKKPVLMAESGAVVKLESPRPYVGKVVNNGYPDKPSFLQGYSIAIPFPLKEESCTKSE